ncbi:MAG: CCA tRNA nucleotidyltransferase [Solirubrobacteraceae bacterium]
MPHRLLTELGMDGWLVGGAVRDELLGRPTADYDVAVPGDPRRAARAAARAGGGHAFELSGAFGAWRVVARDHSWQIDFSALAGDGIAADLAQRDLTINAIARPLAGGDYVDPFAGVSDLRSGVLRMVSAGAFAQDPLRNLRLARLACELAFEIEPGTRAAAATCAPRLAGVAPERIFAELKRILVADRALDGLELMDRLDATGVVLPELARLRGVAQSVYHHLDVFEHTRAVLGVTIELERDPSRWFGVLGPDVVALLAEPLANELNRGQALRFGALMHDIAKPQTRRVSAEGRVTFMGHDVAGAELASSILRRLRASQRLGEYVAAVTRHHLRPGFLVHEMPLERRVIYRYLRVCEPVPADVTLLSVADRLATQGRNSDRAIAKHLELAQQLLAEALAWRAHRPDPPVRGDELSRAIGLAPGPELGRLLAALEEAEFAGEIGSRQDAIELARKLAGRQRETSADR